MAFFVDFKVGNSLVFALSRYGAFLISMARKRMIDPSIWADESFGKMSRDAQILFIGIISNADDEGILPGDALFLTATILPYNGISAKQAIEIRNEVLSKMKSVILYKIDNREYIQLQKWNFYQKVDHPSPSKYPPLPKDYPKTQESFTEDSPKTQESIPPNRIEQNRIEQNRTERKEKEEPSRENSIKYLENIPYQDMNEFISLYVITPDEVRKKSQTLLNYCHMHGKQYKNYKAFLRNVLARDCKKRPDMSKKRLSDLVKEVKHS